MNGIDYYGLLSVAFIIGSLASLFFRSFKIRILAALFLTLILLCPFGENRISPAMRIFAALDTPSLSLLVCAVGNACGTKNRFRLGMPLAVLIIGSALYLTELGVIPYDLYSWGYNYQMIVAAVCIGVIFLNIKEICILLSGFVLFRIGYYSNFFDVFLDPVFVLWSFILVLFQLCQYIKNIKKKKFSEGAKTI